MVKKSGDGKSGIQKTGDSESGAMMSDEQFEQYLEGESPVSKAFKEMEQPEPPAVLDRAILAEAREAARPTHKSWLDSDLAFWRHWAKPLSTAVIMGVCLTVVLRVMDYASLRPPMSEDGPVIALEQKSVTPMREKRALAGAPPAAEFSPDAPAAPARRMRVPVASAPAKPSIEDSMESANDSFLEEIVVAGEQEESSQEIVVSARKQAESLQEVPLSITALQDADTATDDLYAIQEETVVVQDESALEAWAEGARPAAEVWLAGIEALYLPAKPVNRALRPTEQNIAKTDDATIAALGRDVEAARLELARMARVYPAEARQFGKRQEMDTQFDPDEADAAMDDLADPRVWNAGIDWLYINGRDAEAKAELAKLSKVYPDY